MIRPMNTVQSSAVILGGLTLGLSATSFWFTRDAVISRDQARTRTSWEIAQSEATLLIDHDDNGEHWDDRSSGRSLMVALI